MQVSRFLTPYTFLCLHGAQIAPNGSKLWSNINIQILNQHLIVLPLISQALSVAWVGCVERRDRRRQTAAADGVCSCRRVEGRLKLLQELTPTVTFDSALIQSCLLVEGERLTAYCRKMCFTS